MITDGSRSVSLEYLILNHVKTTESLADKNLATAACEHDRPGAPNQTSSDHGNTIAHIHSTFLLSARSSRNACDGPIHVTGPRSSTTVRSESASARSR